MTMPVHPLATGLIDVVGTDNVLQDEAALAHYRRDKSPYPEINPGIVVRPGTVAEIAQVLRLANECRNPVIVRGGGFSMTGFLQLTPGQPIVLDTRRLNRVLEIDEVNMTVTAEAGVIMNDLDARVADRGFAVQTVGIPIQHTTLGGVLSGVAGGGLPSDTTEIGATGRQVVSLNVVLPDGSLLKTNAGGANVHRRASAIPGGDGPFLTGVFIGDGGSFGVKVEATLQITPAAPYTASGQWLLADLASVWRALCALAAMRETPDSGIGVAEGPPWALSYTARASSPDVVAERVRAIEHVLKAHRGWPDLVAERGVPDRDWFVSVDRAIVAFFFGRAQFLDAFEEIRTMLAQHMRDRRLADLGIALKTYIYPHTRHAIYVSISILFDRTAPEGQAQSVALAIETYQHVVALGGWLEPHQGVASRIIAEAWSPTYRRVFQVLKTAVDPNHILNPGLWGVD